MLRADEASSTAILLIDGGYERFGVVQAAEGDEAEGDKAEGRRRRVKWRTARRHRAVDEVADDRRDQLGKPQSLTSCSTLCTERGVHTRCIGATCLPQLTTTTRCSVVRTNLCFIGDCTS